MYMKCATVMIGGSNKSKAGFEALPTMFRANSGNGCVVPEGVDAIKFKHPGPKVVGAGQTVISCDNTKPGGSGSKPSSPSKPEPAPPKPVPNPPTNTGNKGACKEGAITCNANGTWSLCGSGINHNMGAAPGGTKCQNGSFVAARSIRFGPEHKLRRAL